MLVFRGGESGWNILFFFYLYISLLFLLFIYFPFLPCLQGGTTHSLNIWLCFTSIASPRLQLLVLLAFKPHFCSQFCELPSLDLTLSLFWGVLWTFKSSTCFYSILQNLWSFLPSPLPIGLQWCMMQAVLEFHLFLCL